MIGTSSADSIMARLLSVSLWRHLKGRTHDRTPVSQSEAGTPETPCIPGAVHTWRQDRSQM